MRNITLNGVVGVINAVVGCVDVNATKRRKTEEIMKKCESYTSCGTEEARALNLIPKLEFIYPGLAMNKYPL